MNEADLTTSTPRTVVSLTVIDRTGAVHQVTARDGISAMAALRRARLPIDAVCGGCLSCGTCHVHIADAWLGRLPPPTDEELFLVEGVPSFDSQRSRLSCQIRLVPELDGLTLTLAD